MKPSPQSSASKLSAEGALSQTECYTAGALFTIAIHSRQGAYVQSRTAEREADGVLFSEDDTQLLNPSQLDSTHSKPHAPPAHPEGCSPLVAVSDSEATRSTGELCNQVFSTLGVQERAWQGLLHIPSVHVGTPVGDVLDIYLKALKEAEPAERSGGGYAGDFRKSLTAIMYLLVRASFNSKAAERLAEKEQAPKGQKQHAAMDVPTLPASAAASLQRWHDARAAQAIRDLAWWLQPHGGASEQEVEARMALEATRSLKGTFLTSTDAKDPKSSRWSATRAFAVGGTAVVGGAVMAATGGLAAPIIAGALSSAAGLFGGAAAAGAVSGVATATTVTATMGVTGAGVGGRAMARRTGEVREFAFIQVASFLLPNVVHVDVELKVWDGDGAKGACDAPVEVKFTIHENTVSAPSKVSVGLRKIFQSSKPKKYLSGELKPSTKPQRRGSFFSWHSSSKSSPSSGDKGDAADKGTPESAEVETASTSGKGDCAGNRRSSGLGKMEPNEDKSRWTGWKPPLKLAIPWGGCVKKGQVAPECTICIAGWVKSSPVGFVQPFEDILKGEYGWGEPEVYCLVWESQELMQLHTAIMSLVSSYAAGQLSKWFVTSFISSTLMAAMAVPGTMLMATSVIDNAWSMVLDRADKAGVLLAQRLICDMPVSRPVRLVGFSMGARLIFSCLQELDRCGQRGAVREVVMLGAPISITPKKWCAARRAVSGRFINGFCRNDWLLGVVFRTTRAFIKSAAGLQAVSSIVPEANVEDVDLLSAGLVKGHTDYPIEMSRILNFLGVSSDLRGS